jgi:hypothetical protein
VRGERVDRGSDTEYTSVHTLSDRRDSSMYLCPFTGAFLLASSQSKDKSSSVVIQGMPSSGAYTC